jgi:hypothetical protein
VCDLTDWLGPASRKQRWLMPEADDFLTVAEVAKSLKLNQQTGRKLDRPGETPLAAHRSTGSHPAYRLRRLVEASVIGGPWPAPLNI